MKQAKKSKSKKGEETPSLSKTRSMHDDKDDSSRASKKAVEDALRVAEAVALRSSMTPVQTQELTPKLDLGASLREIVEQVEDFLVPHYGVEEHHPEKLTEDLDELDIEAEIGRPESVESSVTTFRGAQSPWIEQENVNVTSRAVTENRQNEDDATTQVVAVDRRTEDSHEFSPVENDTALLSAVTMVPGSVVQDATVGSVSILSQESEETHWETDPSMMRFRLEDKLSYYKEGTYCELLEVALFAGQVEIEEAYKSLKAQFAPEKYHKIGLGSMAEELKVVHNSIEEAYEMLRIDRIREAYYTALQERG